MTKDIPPEWIPLKPAEEYAEYEEYKKKKAGVPIDQTDHLILDELIQLPSEEPIREYSSRVMRYLSIFFAELIGTLILVFITCMGSTETLMPYELTLLQFGITAGFAVLVAMQVTIHISGAYINPVVSLAAAIMEQISWKILPLYVFSELAGGIVGYTLVLAVTPREHLFAKSKGSNWTNFTCGHCVTYPSDELNYGQAIAAEALATCIMVLAICAAWDPRNSGVLDSIAIRIGLLVTAMTIALGGYTGGSMNPARSLPPALIHWQFNKHWIYWVGPLIGSACASVFYRYVWLIEPKSASKKPKPEQTSA